MTHAARVGRGPHIDTGSRAGGTVSGEHVGIFVPGKMRQFVESDKIIGFSLIVGPIFPQDGGHVTMLARSGQQRRLLADVVRLFQVHG